MSGDVKVRLGQLMIEHQMLDRAELIRGLSNQMIYGGRIGTSLVELESIGLEELSFALGEQWHTEPLRPEMVDHISREALDRLAPQQAELFGAVPLSCQADRYAVAMLDPSAENIARIADALQAEVIAYVAPELRLLYLLERHYGIERGKRFLRLHDGGKAPHERRRYLEATVKSEGCGHVGGSSSAANEPPAVALRDERPSFDVAPLTTNGRQAAGQLLEEPGGGIRVRQPGDAGAARTGREERALERILVQIEHVGSGGALARLLVQPITPEAEVALLFWVRGDMAIGCAAHGVDITLDELQQLVIRLDEPSLLHWAKVLEGVVRSRGLVDPIHLMIAEYLGAPEPTDICVAPVFLDGKIVNLICVHAHAGRFDPAVVDDYQRLGRAASVAYERVRQKLRAES